MNRRLAVLSILPLLGLAAVPARSQERPFTALPYTPSLDTSAMDRSVDPCVDFYAFSCGKWLDKNPIPADRSRWSVYSKTANDNQRFLWGMLEEAARPLPGRDANTQKIGDYFASCMDEAAIEKAGIDPLKRDLAAIDGLESRAELATLLGRLHPAGASGEMFFGFGSGQSPKNASQVIGFAGAGGLSLPSPEDYLKDDARSREVRERYRTYVRRLLELLGDPQPARGTEAVLRLETALAKASLTPVERRDPYKTAHVMKRRDLQALTPTFRWDVYLKALGQPGLADFNVTEPRFFQEMEKQVSTSSLDDLRAYLRFHLADTAAPYLSTPFARANFEFYEAYLRGSKEISPRWKRCASWIDRDLGEAVGEVFVAKSFPREIKTDTDRMVRQIRQAMAMRIEQSPWMTAETKKQALVKLQAVRDKVGYPERWRDYSALEVRRGDFTGNVERALAFESRRNLAKIGRPVDRGEWEITPATVNAYYNPSMNDINFPAGVLLPPLYDPRMDAAPNYGNTGTTIGHELTHGFDDEGRQFDDQGNLRDWWTAKDDKEFRQRVACVADQYAQYTVVDDIKINSQLTLGEDVADLGGTLLAYLAWKEETKNQKLETRDGLTPEQRFFVGFAQWDCGGDRPEARRLSARVNPHSPHEFRINGVVVNMPQFAQAFACKPGQPMFKEPAKVCTVW
ncbi:MAG TPA: M13 family metallopeptidase [Thermoanaerobaculia bacterium]|jgi:endothelin-converting enzyme/putative endopeptidase|nr:M13 family metallopeptidase [Thermoanaerobaculia bacterium]